MKKLTIMFALCFLFSCQKTIVKTKNKSLNVATNHQNCYYGYSIFANIDTTKSKK